MRGMTPAEAGCDMRDVLFAFGRGDVTWALIGGGLIFDSGEAENTFMFRCQDRFLAYTSLMGLCSIVLVQDEAHEALYRDLMEQLRSRTASAASLQGLDVRAWPEPVFVRCDLWSLEIALTPSLEAKARALALAGRSVGFVTNQVSPTVARLLAALAALLRQAGVDVVFDAGACEKTGSLALQWHNKARFLSLRDELQARAGLAWVPTLLVQADEFVRMTRGALAGKVASAWGKPGSAGLFVKSAQDSSGNVSAIISTEEGWEHQAPFLADVRRWLLTEDFDDTAHLDELRGECAVPPSLQGRELDDDALRELRHLQASRRRRIPLLIQPALRGAGGAHSVGVSVLAGPQPPGSPFAVTQQLFRDPQCRQFLGVMLSEDIGPDAAMAAAVDQSLKSAPVLAAHGYRGPFNMDFCRAGDGEFRFTGDCNPRLTAVYIPLAARSWLRACGTDGRTLATFGYRGEFVMEDAPRTLDAWQDAGILFNAACGRGMLVLPNLARAGGHDVMAVNLSRAEAAAAFRQMRALTPAVVPQALESVHG